MPVLRVRSGDADEDGILFHQIGNVLVGDVGPSHRAHVAPGADGSGDAHLPEILHGGFQRFRLERACLRHPEVRGFGGDVAFKFGRERTETAVDDGHGKIPCWKLRERGRGEGVLRAAAPRVLF